jgi:hypothetical protein
MRSTSQHQYSHSRAIRHSSILSQLYLMGLELSQQAKMVLCAFGLVGHVDNTHSLADAQKRTWCKR